MRIFITGGTGLVGSRLIKKLLERQDQVVVLTRRPESARQKWGDKITVVQGDPQEKGPWMDAVKGCDGVVNLVGEGIFNRRWSADFKETLRKSRVVSTQNVVAALGSHAGPTNGRARVLVSASAIGFYGPHGSEELTETSPPGSDTLAKLCVDWEHAALAGNDVGVRVVLLRVGVVLDPEGGALKKMLLPFKMFVGGPIGSGSQYMSWIHHEDLVGLILFALDNQQVTGPINGSAPNPVTNRQFSTALGKALGRPSIFPTPGFVLRLTLGEVSNVITKGQCVIPRKPMDLGYNFHFSDVNEALKNVLK